MSLGMLRPDKALAAAHKWVHAALTNALRRDYPGAQLAALYNDKALAQIKTLVGGIAAMYAPPPAKPPPEE